MIEPLNNEDHNLEVLMALAILKTPDMAVSHLSENELAARWQMSPKTLQNMRVKGHGPQYLKIGRMVRYPLDIIEQYELSCRVQSTSE